MSLLASKVREESELPLLDPLRAELSVELIGVVPYDDTARLADQAGLPPIEVVPDSALVEAVSRLAESLTTPRPALV